MPSRIIRECCRTSPTLDQISGDAERLFWRLTTVADDFGRFEADPRILISACFPLRIGSIKPATISKWFSELEACGLVRTFADNGRRYGFFLTWAKHQRVRAVKSKYPEPPKLGKPADIRGHPLSNASGGMGYGVEGKEHTSKVSDPDPEISPNGDVRAVYQHYLKARNIPASKYSLTPKRAEKIRARLKEFEIGCLTKAIDACLASPFHRGENDRGRLYCDIADHIFRSQEKTEHWVNEWEGLNRAKA
jgi:hypothetical protein